MPSINDTKHKLTDKEIVTSADSDDTIFVNINGAVKQIAIKDALQVEGGIDARVTAVGSDVDELNSNLGVLDNNIKGFKVYTFSLPASTTITLNGKGAYLLVVYHNGYANGNLHYYGFVTLLSSATSIITELRKGSNINVTGGSAGSLTIENTSTNGAAGVRIYSLASSTDITQV